MKPSTKKTLVGSLSFIAIAGLALWLWRVFHPPVVPTVAITDFDALQTQLSERVFKEYGGAEAGKDFQVVVAMPTSRIGMLLRPQGSLPANDEDCTPTPLPKSVPHGHLFPDYTLSSSTALLANVGKSAVKALGSAALHLGSDSVVTYRIDDPQIALMSDSAVEGVTQHGNCHAFLQSHKGLRLIRGSVIGRTTYTVKVANPESVSAQLSKSFGDLSLSIDPNRSSISIADVDRQPIVDLLTLLPAAPATTSSPDSEPRRQPSSEVVKPSVPQEEPSAKVAGVRIFVQADTKEPPANSSGVVQLLADNWPKASVVPQVEHLPSQKMPEGAQVRFFNSGDLNAANKCVDILRKRYPDARVVRIGLSSPGGQLEVWLPKFAGSPR